MSVVYTDSHCHLDPDVFGDDANVDAVVARARAADVMRMVAIGSGYGAQSLARAVSVAERHADVWAVVGVHPHDAKMWGPEVAAELRSLAAHPRVVALGEMGLDFHYDSSPRDQQRDALRAQIRLSLELRLPIVIHDRESHGETLRILDEEGAFSGVGVLYHCYTGDAAHMADIVARGGYISLSGIVTFKNAGVTRQVAQDVPLDRLLIETDTPFLTPVPHRGTRNEPARVPYVAAAIATARGVDVAEVARATWENTTRFFGLP